MGLNFKDKGKQVSAVPPTPDPPTPPRSLKKKKSIVALFVPSPDPASEHDDDVPTSSQSVQTIRPANAFVPKSIWAKRHNMKLHPYPNAVPYMQAYDPILLESDRYSDLLLQRLGQGAPSFCFFGKHLPSTVLDLGCGPGHWLLHAAGVWKHAKFTGFDLVNVCLPALDSAENIRFVQGDFLNHKLPFPDQSFDYVRMANLVLCVPYDKWEDLIAQVYRILTPNGRLEIIDDQIYFPYSQPPSERPPPLMQPVRPETAFFDALPKSLDVQSLAQTSTTDDDTLQDERFTDAESTLHSSTGFTSRPTSIGSAPEHSSLPESSTIRQVSAYLPPTPESIKERLPSNNGIYSNSSSNASVASLYSQLSVQQASFPSSSDLCSDSEEARRNMTPSQWQHQATVSRDLEKVFEKMLGDKFGIFPQPSEFILSTLMQTFGEERAGKTRSFHVKLAPADSPMGLSVLHHASPLDVDAEPEIGSEFSAADTEDMVMVGQDLPEEVLPPSIKKSKSSWKVGMDWDKRKEKRVRKKLEKKEREKEKDASAAAVTSPPLPGSLLLTPPPSAPHTAKRFPVMKIISRSSSGSGSSGSGSSNSSDRSSVDSTLQTPTQASSAPYGLFGDANPYTIVPSSMNRKAAGWLGLEYVPTTADENAARRRKRKPKLDEYDFSSSESEADSDTESSCISHLPLELGEEENSFVWDSSEALTPIAPQSPPVVSAKAAGRLGISYSELAEAAAMSTRPRPRLSTPPAPPLPPQISTTQHPGLLVLPSSYLAMGPAELEMHACKYVHTLLGCRPALSEFVSNFVDEEGERYVGDEEFQEIMWQYECFRRTRFNWPSEVPELYEDDSPPYEFGGQPSSPTTANNSTTSLEPPPLMRTSTSSSSSTTTLPPSTPASKASSGGTTGRSNSTEASLASFKSSFGRSTKNLKKSLTSSSATTSTSTSTPSTSTSSVLPTPVATPSHSPAHSRNNSADQELFSPDSSNVSNVPVGMGSQKEDLTHVRTIRVFQATKASS